MPDLHLIPLHDKTGEIRAYATVDAEDSAHGDHRWSLSTEGYAKRTVRADGRKLTVYLHRVIAAAEPGQDVDHISRDRLDCRRANLRICTRAQNLQNVAARGGTSQHRGVSFHKRAGRWRADVKLAGRQHYLGLFDTEDEAAAAAAAKRADLMTHATA